MKDYLLLIILNLLCFGVFAQNGTLKGKVYADGQPLPSITLRLSGAGGATKTDGQGFYQFKNLSPGTYILSFSGLGYQSQSQKITIKKEELILPDVLMLVNLSNLNEVVVTGVSRGTVLRKSPVPIAVLSRKAMDQHVNNNLIDAIVKGVPGLSAVTTGPNISKPFIRGLGYNRVLTLYDGLRQEGQQWGDEHGIEMDQYGVSRVEVVKGPASLTYGSDAVAGVINMIPETSSFKEGVIKGDFTEDYHTNNGMFGTSLGLGYVKNDWKYNFRASGKLAHSYRNKVDGPVYGTAFREYNLSGSVRTDKKWGYTKIAANLYDNLQEIPDGSRDSLSRKFTRQVLDDGDDLKNRPLVPEGELITYKIMPLHQHIQHYRLYNKTQLKLGTGSLDVLLGAQQSIRREYNHPTLAEQPGLYVVLNSFNFDLKYNLPEFKGIESTAGLSGMYQTNRSKNATDFPIPDYNLFDVGGFLFAKKTFGKIDISGGLRFDHRHIRWNDFYVGQNPQTGFDQQVREAETADAKLQFPAFDHSYKGLSGSLGLTYNLTERLLLKANVSRGYRAPNITEIGSNGLDPGAHIVYLGNRSFVPEFNLQQDIGFIAYLKDMDISVELFNNNIQNYIYQTRLTDAAGEPVVVVPGNLTYQYQQAKARLYGAEFSLNLHPEAFKWLNFNNSLAYVRGTTMGQNLPLLPPLHIRSEIKFSSERNYGIFHQPYLKFEADVNAAQNHFYGLYNTETYTKGYTLFNAGLGAAIKNRNLKKLFDLFIQADNLFDVAYQSHLSRLKYFEYYENSPNGRRGIYNIGRNFSFKVVVPI